MSFSLLLFVGLSNQQERPRVISFTLSANNTGSIISRRRRASEYSPFCTSSSICAAHDFIRNCQIELPSVAAAVRSVGVVTRKRGDLSMGDGVRRRITALAGVADDGLDTSAEDGGREAKGKGSV